MSDLADASAGADRPAYAASALLDLLDHIPAMVALWDGDLRNRFANRLYTEWFGVGPEITPGMHMRDVVGADLFERLGGQIAGVQAGEPQLFERRVVDTAGHIRYAQTTYTPIRIDGVVDGFAVLATDISNRVDAESKLRDSTEQISLSRERQRIAADLHDLIVQRLFVLALELEAAKQLPPAEAMAQARAAVPVLNDVIAELQQSVYRLARRGVDEHSPMAEIDEVVQRSAAALGFTPSSSYSGAIDSLAPELTDALIAVVNEALSNVAKHAAAGSVSVRLSVNERAVTVRVTDDGRGMGAPARASGTRNIRNRADEFGGWCEWSAAEPTGTELTWQVPR
jgi:PAS domain S-box-containing protein